MNSLPQLVRGLWGKRAPNVVQQYREAFDERPLVEADLAAFCNAGSPITGTSEFERGVEEGKRRVWLHIARMRGLTYRDFVPIADGAKVHE